MGLTESLASAFRWLLALLGFGGFFMYATGQWTVPQTTVYASLVTDTTWAHNGSTVSCIWEIHPNTTKTINSVSYNLSGSWSGCSQSSGDWLLWTCGSLTANASIQPCPAVRVIQNENPGTSETIFNGNVTTPNIFAISGCAGSEICTISVPLTLSSGNYIHRRIVISQTLTMNGNVTLIGSENISITSTGSIALNPGIPRVILKTLFFSNAGSITSTGSSGSDGSCYYMYGECGFGSGPQEQCGCTAATSGSSAGDVYLVGMKNISNTGTISLTGGSGGGGAGFCSPCSVCSTGGATGGAGGRVYIINSTSSLVNTGTIRTTAGTGGLGGCYGSCATHYGSLSSTSASGDGGTSGNLTLSLFDLNTTGTFVADGGTGGSGGSGHSCTYSAGSTGAGGTNTVNVSRNISASGSMSSVNGAWNVAYCANGTGNNWANFNPAASQSSHSCDVAPAFSFVSPTSTSNYTALLQNVTVNLSNSNSSVAYVLQYSNDNGSTWDFVTQQQSFPPAAFTNVFAFSTHRNGSDTAKTTIFRAMSLNNSSGIYSEWLQVNFNLTDIQANLSQSSSPSGNVTTPSVMFYCNYTNSSGSAIEAATARIILDGTLYSLIYNVTNGRYYYLNTNVWTAGNHTWNCVMDKANYAAKNGTNTTIVLSGYGLFIAGGQSQVKLTCPFPTIYGMTPAGQKAGIGIFRLQNYNTTANKNYGLLLNNTPAAGISVYARCDKFVSNPSNYTGWTLLNTTDFHTCLTNINSTNASAYVWLKMDCVDVVPGTYSPFGFIFQEG